LRRLQAPVRQDEHPPTRPDPVSEQAQEPDPVRVPGPRLVARQGRPGHRHGAGPVDGRDAQDRHAVAQRGRVDRQGQGAVAPAGEDPLQQRAEAGLRVQLATAPAALRGRRPVELAEPLADRADPSAQQGRQVDGHPVQAAGARQDHAEAVPRHAPGLAPRQVGEPARDAVGPLVE
ncbi:hypothetical protein HK102_011431, partial [Quaeritorhiza haematococci]